MASYNRHFGYKYSHFGEDAHGHDLKVFSDTTGHYLFYDASADTLYLIGALSHTGAYTVTGNLTVTGNSLLKGTFGTGTNGTTFTVTATGALAIATDKFTVSAAGAVVAASTVKSTGNFTVGDNKMVVTASTGSATLGQLKVTSLFGTQGLDAAHITVGTNSAPILVATFTDHVAGVYTNLQLKADAAKTLLGGYFKVQTDGATAVASAQLVAVAPRVALDQAVDTAYGVQSHLTHSGTGAVNEAIAVSAYIDTAGNFTATGRVAALQAMIEGSSTITGDVFVAYLVNAGTIQTTDAIAKLYNQSAAETTTMLLIDNDNATPADDPIMIDLEGRATHGIRMSNMTLSQGTANHFIEIGTYASAMSLALTDTVMASLTNLKVTNDGGSSAWVIADYSKITIDDENSQPNNNVAVYRPKLAIETNIENAWGIQLDVNCTGTWATNDLIGIGVFMDLGSGTITSTPGKVAGLQVDVYGEGTAAVTGNCYAGLFRGRGNITGVLDAIVQLENQNGAVTSILGMDVDGTCTYAFNFGGAACDAWTSGSAAILATTNDVYVKIPVNVEGAGKTLYLLAAADWTAS